MTIIFRDVTLRLIIQSIALISLANQWPLFDNIYHHLEKQLYDIT